MVLPRPAKYVNRWTGSVVTVPGVRKPVTHLVQLINNDTHGNVGIVKSISV